MIKINYISKHKCGKNSLTTEKHYNGRKIYSLRISKNEHFISGDIVVGTKVERFDIPLGYFHIGDVSKLVKNEYLINILNKRFLNKSDKATFLSHKESLKIEKAAYLINLEEREKYYNDVLGMFYDKN